MDDAIYEHQCPFTVLRHVRSDSIAPFASINSLYDAQAWENGKPVLRTSNALCDVQGMGFNTCFNELRSCIAVYNEPQAG